MQAIALSDARAIELSMVSDYLNFERLGSAFNFMGPRGKQQAAFCSDCCGSNGNSCNPQQD